MMKKLNIEKLNIICFIISIMWLIGPFRSSITDISIMAVSFLNLGLLLYKFKKDSIEVIKKYILLYVFGFFTMISFVWSTNRIETLKASLLLILLINSMVYYNEIYGPKKILKYLIRSFSVIMLLNLIYLIIFPYKALVLNWRKFYALQGLFVHKNTLGLFCVFSIIFSMQIFNLESLSLKEIGLSVKNIFNKDKYIKKNNFKIEKINFIELAKKDEFYSFFNILVGSIFIYLSKSSTALGILLIIIFLYIVRNIKIHTFIFYGSFIFIFMNKLILENPIVKYLVEDVLHRSITFTGRTRIWSFLGEMIWNKPVLGYGYYNIWNTDLPGILNVYSKYGKTVKNAHNVFYDLWARIGIIGLMIFIVLIISTFNKAMKTKNQGIVILLIVLVAINCFESSFLARNSVEVLMLVFAINCISSKKKLLDRGKYYENIIP